jgi:hypothetical protein
MTPEQEWDKKLRRILQDPGGREALKRVGIEIEMHEEQKDKPTVVLLCPTYRNPEAMTRDSLGKMVRFTNESGKATVYGGPPVQSSVVHWSRNWLMGEQIKSGKPWSHALYTDDDMVPEEDALVRLLSHKKDIIAGLCTRRNDPPVPNIRFYDKESGETRQIWEWPEGQVFEVDSVGTGFMLISQHAMEQVAQVYFDCLYEKEFYGLSGARLDAIRDARLKKFDSDKICYWFRFLPTEKGDIEMGEDVSFCYLATRYCGLKVFVDGAVLPGHIGPYAYSIKDFLPYRDMCIERAKRMGTYKVQPRLESEIQVVS